MFSLTRYLMNYCFEFGLLGGVLCNFWFVGLFLGCELWVCRFSLCLFFDCGGLCDDDRNVWWVERFAGLCF